MSQDRKIQVVERDNQLVVIRNDTTTTLEGGCVPAHVDRVIVGRLNQLAAPFMVVSDAYTVQSDVNAESKDVTWSVVTRGDGGSQPTTVIVGAQQVVSVEAVRPGSRLATLLDEVRAKR